MAVALLLLAAAAQAAWVPSDIAAYIERRKACNHWGGEEPYGKARATEINRAMMKLNCGGLDADERMLLRRYRSTSAFLTRIRAAKDALL